MSTLTILLASGGHLLSSTHRRLRRLLMVGPYVKQLAFLMYLSRPCERTLVGLFPDADSALASLPEAYFSPQTCAEVQARWAARSRPVVEATEPLGAP